MLKKTLAFGLLVAGTIGLSGPALADENVQSNQSVQQSDATAVAIGDGANANVFTHQEADNTNFIYEDEGYSSYGYGYYGQGSEDVNVQSNQSIQQSDATAAAIGDGADANVFTHQDADNTNFIYEDDYSSYGYGY